MQVDPNYGTQLAQGVPFALAYEELFLELTKVASVLGYQVRSDLDRRELAEYNYPNRENPLAFDHTAKGDFRPRGTWSTSESAEDELAGE